MTSGTFFRTVRVSAYHKAEQLEDVFAFGNSGSEAQERENDDDEAEDRQRDLSLRNEQQRPPDQQRDDQARDGSHAAGHDVRSGNRRDPSLRQADECRDRAADESPGHFDPALVDVFREVAPQFEAVFEEVGE